MGLSIDTHALGSGDGLACLNGGEAEPLFQRRHDRVGRLAKIREPDGGLFDRGRVGMFGRGHHSFTSSWSENLREIST